METAEKIQTTFRFDPQLIKHLKAAAKKERRSLNNYVETILNKAVNEHQPNEETLAAMFDAENGIGLKECDISSLEAFMKSMED